MVVSSRRQQHGSDSHRQVPQWTMSSIATKRDADYWRVVEVIESMGDHSWGLTTGLRKGRHRAFLEARPAPNVCSPLFRSSPAVNTIKAHGICAMQKLHPYFQLGCMFSCRWLRDMSSQSRCWMHVCDGSSTPWPYHPQLGKRTSLISEA